MNNDQDLSRELGRLAKAVRNIDPDPEIGRRLEAEFARLHRRPERPRIGIDFDWFAWPVALLASIMGLVWLIDPDPAARTPLGSPPGTLSAYNGSGTARAQTGFIPVSSAADLAGAGQALLVNASLPRTALAEFGLPIDPDRAGEPVRAELLYRQDGMLLAVRFAAD